ncbi:MAG: hypothetical protein M0010_23555 [Actinomycetota bacterium]|nr:hypothetical protein [Actinomycetota bacterium]
MSDSVLLHVLLTGVQTNPLALAADAVEAAAIALYPELTSLDPREHVAGHT